MYSPFAFSQINKVDNMVSSAFSTHVDRRCESHFMIAPLRAEKYLSPFLTSGHVVMGSFTHARAHDRELSHLMDSPHPLPVRVRPFSSPSVIDHPSLSLSVVAVAAPLLRTQLIRQRHSPRKVSVTHPVSVPSGCEDTIAAGEQSTRCFPASLSLRLCPALIHQK